MMIDGQAGPSIFTKRTLLIGRRWMFCSYGCCFLKPMILCLTPLWKIWKSIGMIIPKTNGKIIQSCSSHHQPDKLDTVCTCSPSWFGLLTIMKKHWLLTLSVSLQQNMRLKCPTQHVQQTSLWIRFKSFRHKFLYMQQIRQKQKLLLNQENCRQRKGITKVPKGCCRYLCI